MRSRLIIALLLLNFVPAFAQEQLLLFNPKLLHVRFPDDAGYRVVEGRLLSPAGRSSAPESLTGLGWWSRISRVSDDRLRAMRETASRNLDRHIADPTASFHFHLYEGGRLLEAMRQLQAFEGVQQVRKVPVPRNALAPDYLRKQTYISDSSSGINADSIHLVYGNRGAGIRICDIEYNFNALHADLPPVTVIGPPPISAWGDDHGTAVLGELASLNDSTGTTGIASDSRVFFAGAYVQSGPDTIYDIEGPILNAAAAFTAGDVILLEQQMAGPNYDTSNPDSQEGLIAVEWFEPYYDAILLATGNGIVVVEAAGNGQQNFDGPEYITGNGGHYPFAPGKHSGAIIVGAGSTDDPLNPRVAPRSRLWYSNTGSRVDLQANGERVVTTGYGSLYSAEGVNRHYTAEFGGTSSASPIVAGAVVLLQSVHKAKNAGKTLSPKQVRDLLVKTGKEQQAGRFGDKRTAHIGPLPDVYAALRSIFPLSVPDAATPMQAALYPNPSGDEVRVLLEGASPGPVGILVYNALGSCVFRQSAVNVPGALRIDVSRLPAGLYQVQVRSGNAVSWAKLTVLH